MGGDSAAGIEARGCSAAAPVRIAAAVEAVAAALRASRTEPHSVVTAARKETKILKLFFARPQPLLAHPHAG